MSKKGTIGYQADQLRRKGQRRIERLQAVLKAEDTPERIRNWASRQVREIKSAIQGTRQYSKTGKRYKSKTVNYIKGQISRLEAAVKEVAPKYTVAGDSFEVTQRELNRASVKLPSIYTKPEVQTFYQATQRIWQRENVGEHNRNEAILDYYNSIRKENGLSPLRLDQIVDYVLKANDKVRKAQKIKASDIVNSEAMEFYEASIGDNMDGSYNSNSAATTLAIQGIRDALENLLVLPNPLAVLAEG